MTHALMLLGTHSNAGKSLLTTAFCRILARRGYRVAPFKAQNMSNNAGVTPAGGEMGRAQLVQAEAAGVAPHTDMNPVLLKPEGNRRSQIVLNGRVHGRMDAANWYDIKQTLWREVCAAYDRLASRFDVIVLEGAGSPAEINLKEGDIVNLRMARYADAPCLLVGDIDRGGVFAALAGTMLLLEPEERRQICGFLINKFRGDPALLGDGLTMLQEKAFGVPTLGVIPFIPDLRIAAEDAVALDAPQPTLVAQPGAVDIAIIHLPHIANFDEFDSLRNEPGVGVRFVRRRAELGRPHAIILPGSKVTISDLAWLRSTELDVAIRQLAQSGTAVVGICGGFQMLGRALRDPAGVESPPGSATPGLDLLPIATTFIPAKQTHRARMTVRHPSLEAGSVVSGYEIHTGETTLLEPAPRFGQIVERSQQPVQLADGAVSDDGRIWGTYLHDIFTNAAFRRTWLRQIGWRPSAASLSTAPLVASPSTAPTADYDRLADVVENAIGWEAIAHVLGLSAG